MEFAIVRKEKRKKETSFPSSSFRSPSSKVRMTRGRRHADFFSERDATGSSVQYNRGHWRVAYQSYVVIPVLSRTMMRGKGEKKKKNERKRKGSIRESRGCFSGRAHKSKRKALGSIPNRKLNDITRFYVIIQFSFFFLFFFPPLVSLSSHGLCHADACISPVRSSVSIARSPFDFSSLLNGLEKTRKQRASR